MANVVIGIDIGTQGTKAAFFDQHGKVLSETFEASQPIHGNDGSITEDPAKQLSSVINTLKNGLKKGNIHPPHVAGVAIDSQMAGVIGVGKDGKNITPYDSWLDTRCAPYIKQMETGAGKEVLRKTGCAPSFNHGPKKLWWKHQHPEVYRQIAAFVQPGGYAAMCLTGKQGHEAFVDATYLHFSGFANNEQAKWDQDLCQGFQLDINKLPQIVEPQQVVGEITREMAALTGLQQGTPVVAGCGDTIASFVSAGATRPGTCVDVAGTASVFCATVDRFKPDVENAVLACGRSVVPGLWYNYAYINGGGQNLEWFKEQLAKVLPADQDPLDFPALNQLAKEAGFNKDNPLFIPHLGGRVCPSQPWLRGAWLNLNWSHGVGHLYRSLLEGIALEYGIYLDISKKMYPKLKMNELNVVGGGTNSQLWNQIKADVLGIDVVKLERSKGAPMGSAILAGYGVGLFNDIHDTVQQWIKKEPPLNPGPERHEFYTRHIHKYSDFMDAINQITEKEY